MLPQFIVSVVVIAILANVILGACAYLIFLERKVAAWTQDRIGPNRTNLTFGQGNLLEKFGLGKLAKAHMFGLGQALADGLKLLLKEDYTPPHVDKILFVLAPALVVMPAILGWAIVPWGGYVQLPAFSLFGWDYPATVVSVAAAPISIGVVYILAISGVAVYGVVLGAYASNNKYSFLGGLRATAQMLSYEIPMGVCVLVMILMYHTTDAGLMSAVQATGTDGQTWGILSMPLLAIIFFICSLAETNRAPFDLAEAEQELVGGFHTEYGSMKWALFFLGEYMHMITGSAFFAILFLGGWDLLPFIGVLPVVADGWFLAGTDWAWAGSLLLVLVKLGIFAGKVTFLLFVMMWVRWTLPRLRFDQLMRLAWRGLIPITIVMMLVAGVMVFMGIKGWWWYTLANVVVMIGAAITGPKLPRDDVNRRIPLRGSRFNPLPPEAA